MYLRGSSILELGKKVALVQVLPCRGKNTAGSLVISEILSFEAVSEIHSPFVKRPAALFSVRPRVIPEVALH